MNLILAACRYPCNWDFIGWERFIIGIVRMGFLFVVLLAICMLIFWIAYAASHWVSS